MSTAFIIESYKLLQPDGDDYVAAALYAIALAGNSSGSVQLRPPGSALTSTPTGSSRWINGLWFTSLFLALAVSLLCILGKQWLTEYTGRTKASSSDPKAWARRHAVLHTALRQWHMSGFISILPLLLHLALFLFLVGLGLFLLTLDGVLGAWLMALAGSLVLFYVGTIAVPLWKPECPTSTPLVDRVRQLLIRILEAGLALGKACNRCVGPYVTLARAYLG